MSLPRLSLEGFFGRPEADRTPSLFDPAEPARRCRSCRKPLTHPVSQRRGLGPECAAKLKCGGRDKPMKIPPGLETLETQTDVLRAATCGVRVRGNVVVATEIPSNPGMSVTNAAERFAAAACEKYGIPREELVWIEHYPDRMDRLPESFDLVVFEGPGDRDRLGSPKWKRIDREEAERLYGSALYTGDEE